MKWCLTCGMFLVSVLLSPAAYGADWSRIGADAGMSKYSPDNISARARLELRYSMRFYGKYTPNTGNFFYGSSVVTRGGKAVIVADDRWGCPAPDRITFMQFDWQTGQAEGYYPLPWPFWQNDREIDSHHYTNTLIWHTDGRVYMRRGGDAGSSQVFLPQTGELFTIYNRSGQTIPQYDATALMQTYQDMLLCRYGHTYFTKDYCAVSVSQDCYAAPNQVGQADILGRYIMDIGPSVSTSPTTATNGLYGLTGRYGDIPKCANGVCVVAALVYSRVEPHPNNVKLWLEATDLATSQTLWCRNWTSDTGGQQGLGTSISDYWRFVAADSGQYVFFTRAPQQPVTVRAVDLCSGVEQWSKPLANAQERPLLACHDGSLYVIGRAEQYKLDIRTGSEVWHTTYSWPNDRGYVLGNHALGSTAPTSQDPLYRPAVLTDSTLWFVDGDRMAASSEPTAAVLVGVRTSDGQVVQTIDLRQLYGHIPGERLLVVNDVLLADRLLGVLVGVRSSQSPYPRSNGVDYQDLHVFRAYLPGDINADGAVGLVDLQILLAAWNTVVGGAGYNQAADLNRDGRINVGDLQALLYLWEGG